VQQAITTDVKFLIESTIQESAAKSAKGSNSDEEPDYYNMLGGGMNPTEVWEEHQNEMEQLKELDEEMLKEQRHKLLDTNGNDDPLFYIRKANSNLRDTTKAKLLISKALLAWKHILKDNLEVATYITSASIWIGVKGPNRIQQHQPKLRIVLLQTNFHQM
jgi:hypothetical protein